MDDNAHAPHLLGFNGPPDDAPIMSTCDDGKPIRLPDGSAHAGAPSLFVAFFLYAWLWVQDTARFILAGRVPSLPYFSRPMPMIPSITGGVDHSVKASMQGRKRGGPQAFTGAWHACDRCRSPAYLPESVVVITPGFSEVRTSSGATHIVPNGDWHAKRRTSAMARAASLTFGRPRTRGAVKA